MTRPPAWLLRPLRHRLHRLGRAAPLAAHADRAPRTGAIHLLSFATPAWLLGLLLVPVIRWLHRGGPQLRSVPVASLALWRKAADGGPVGGRAAAARPGVATPRAAGGAAVRRARRTALAAPVERITLWVDDSLSMLTREAGGTRLETGLAKVAARAGLAARRRGRGAHARQSVAASGRAAARDDRRDWSATPDSASRPPPPAGLLRADRRHWLLTDGADAEFIEAAAGIGYSRVFRVGEITRNAGIVRLSARRSLGDRDRLDLELQVSNGGDTAEERVAILSTESGEVTRASMKLAPGASATVSAVAPMAAAVQARLEPGDALADDDTLTLDASPLLARRVAADPACPAGILAALQAHPALSVTEDAAVADLAVECGGTAGTAGTAKCRASASCATACRSPWRVLTWSSSVSETQRAHVSTRSRCVRADGSRHPAAAMCCCSRPARCPLIVQRRSEGAPLIETALDAESADRDRPVAPLLVSFLVDQALSTALLDGVAVVARDERAVRVVPRDGAAGAANGLGDVVPADARLGRSAARGRRARAAVGTRLAAAPLAPRACRGRGVVVVKAILPRTATATVLQALALVALLLALAGVRWLDERARPGVLVLVDRSLSVPQAAADEALAGLRAAATGRHFEWLEFAGRAGTPGPPLAEAVAPTARDRGADEDLLPSVTDLERALDAALAAHARHPYAAAVVVSDGRANAGDTDRALSSAREAGLPVRWITVARPAPAAWIADVQAPTRARRGQPLRIVVPLAGDTARTLRVTATARHASGAVITVDCHRRTRRRHARTRARARWPAARFAVPRGRADRRGAGAAARRGRRRRRRGSSPALPAGIAGAAGAQPAAAAAGRSRPRLRDVPTPSASAWAATKPSSSTTSPSMTRAAASGRRSPTRSLVAASACWCSVASARSRAAATGNRCSSPCCPCCRSRRRSTRRRASCSPWTSPAAWAKAAAA